MPSGKSQRNLNRELLLKEIQNQQWDLVVVGGGATGLGVALDAAQRGLKVALIEKNDYASGPTSTSTKLIHGGVRYLEKAVKELNWGQYQLVKEALHERKIMLKNAPHLSKPIPFIIPVYSWWQKMYYSLGTKIYDWIAGKDEVPNAYFVSPEFAIKKFPNLNSNHLHGAVVYHDGQFNDAFYATALMRTALLYGACCLNYVELNHVDFNQNLGIHFLNVQDKRDFQSFEIKTSVLVNCTGVHADSIRKMVIPELQPRLRPSKGIHMVLPRTWLPTDYALLIPSTEDGRVVFVIPWYYAVIIGTTDTEIHDAFSVPTVEPEDIEYLIRQVNPYLSKKIEVRDIQATFAGYRPLVKAHQSKTEALIRNHEIEIFPEKKFVSVLGGKWTTYRKMAEDAVNQVFKLLNKPFRACQTKELALIGCTNQIFENKEGLPENIHQHLLYYGSEYPVLVDYLKKYGAKPLLTNYPFTIGEAIFLKEHGQIHTFEDYIQRGTRIGIIDFQAVEVLRSNQELLAIFEK